MVWSNTLVLGTSAKELLMLIPNEAEEATRRLQTSFFPAQNELPAKITICGHFFFSAFSFWRAERISANEVGIQAEMELKLRPLGGLKSWPGKWLLIFPSDSNGGLTQY